MSYLMENCDEAFRLEIKTDPKIVFDQAEWGGIKPGMRVLDIGCGAGVTTKALSDLVGPTGEVVGIDFSESRLELARERYGGSNISFINRDIRKPLDDIPEYDAVWVRFVLEYFCADAVSIIENITARLKPGGILCMVDLDCNSMLHFGHSSRIQQTMEEIMCCLERDFDFDPYAGRKLYSHLFDLGYDDIDIRVDPHHLIFGELRESDAYNWGRKLELTVEKSGCSFTAYNGDHNAFLAEFKEFFNSLRRFTYTPMILARGQKPG